MWIFCHLQNVPVLGQTSSFYFFFQLFQNILIVLQSIHIVVTEQKLSSKITVDEKHGGKVWIFYIFLYPPTKSKTYQISQSRLFLFLIFRLASKTLEKSVNNFFEFFSPTSQQLPFFDVSSRLKL